MRSNRMEALADVPLKNIQVPLSVLNVFKNTARTPMNPVEKAAVIFDMAILKTGVKPEWIAAELSSEKHKFRVSVVLVSYWRNPSRPECPTNAHIIALGDDFERAYARCQSLVNGWGRAALVDVLVSMGELAEAISA